MAAVGGPIESITIGGRAFAVAQDAGVTRDLGGFTKTVEMNGDGTGRAIMERRPWLIEGLTLNIDDDKGDQEFLQDIADDPDFTDFAVVFASGAIYSGSGTLTDALNFDNQKALGEAKFSGPGKLTKQ